MPHRIAPPRRTSLAVLSLCMALALFIFPLTAQAGTLELTQALHADLPPTLFALTYRAGNDGFFYTSAITVAHADTRQVLQHLPLSPEAQSLESDTLGLALEDLNFDGYLDMRIMAFLPNSGNVPYHVWLWDAPSQQFVYSEPLSALTSPEPDAAAQRVRSFVREDADTYVQAAYAWVEGDLVLTDRTITYYDMPNGVVHTAVETLQEGHLVLVAQYDQPFGQPEDEE